MAWNTTDSKGNDYTKVGGADDTKAIISLNGLNELLKGKLNISLRQGSSGFGSEIVIQFKVEEHEKTYTTSSPWNHIEFYLPKELGASYLLEMAKILGGEIKGFDKDDWTSVHCEKCGEQAYCDKCKGFIWRKK